ncbi:glycosyltransferase [Pontibacter diazotrophicus]|uniref:Glycosyltransferase n=1 Tax=Pontibacter diazotrophicus TaxID=1400979 RepID=A0A3D8L148_9BACT|nr:glycosyltransferase [Pontibacter diazotrophicus]RDV11095.1 glycosyltransferase [Pontibacter diazotrophicus]
MIAIIQPFVPHYRTDFFNKLSQKIKLDLYCYQGQDKLKASNFFKGKVKASPLKAIAIGPLLVYNPFALLDKKYDTLVLMLHFGHLTTWLILLLKPLLKKKIILWGHGISIKRYIKEESKPNIFLKWMIGLSDGLWVYTDKEYYLWNKQFPKLSITSLGNTISNVEDIVKLSDEKNKRDLKLEFKIFQPRVLIYCARFNEPGRRVDLLLKLIENLDPEKYAFIIIGAGRLKPDFIKFRHVYDFGEVYERNLKEKLFNIADVYFQPGWVGLSVVEAMAYGKPVFTFERSKDVLQCVEYHYIKSGYNGMIFKTFTECLERIVSLTEAEIDQLSSNALEFVKKELTMEKMVSQAFRLLEDVCKGVDPEVYQHHSGIKSKS